MRWFWGATTLLAVGACAAEGEPVAMQQRPIVRGTVSAEGAWPAVVSLGGCTGTLISPRVVLTARHCGTPQAVCFGNRSNSSCPWIDVIDGEQHPATDIGILTLAEPGPTAPIPIGRVDLTSAHVGQAVTIVGFGQTGEYESDGGIKREGETAIHSFNSEEVVVGEAPSAHTCYGDSGGPYFTEWDGVLTVFGVTSYGTALCETGLAVGMRVDPVQDWVDAYIAEHDPPLCGDDGRCAEDCPALDTDCCDAADGACTEACGAELDPDCRTCEQDGWCVADCTTVDPDCCDGTDGVCDDACGPALDPDCDDDGGGGGGGGGDDDDDGGPGQVTGGCSLGGPAMPGTWMALVLAHYLLVTRRRTR
jgi:hypothetical protein